MDRLIYSRSVALSVDIKRCSSSRRSQVFNRLKGGEYGDIDFSLCVNSEGVIKESELERIQTILTKNLRISRMTLRYSSISKTARLLLSTLYLIENPDSVPYNFRDLEIKTPNLSKLNKPQQKAFDVLIEGGFCNDKGQMSVLCKESRRMFMNSPSHMSRGETFGELRRSILKGIPIQYAQIKKGSKTFDPSTVTTKPYGIERFEGDRIVEINLTTAHITPRVYTPTPVKIP